VSVVARLAGARACRLRCRAAVYYALLLGLLALVAAPAAAQVELSVDPAMVRGPADAPVKIVEFTDYQ